MDMHDVPLLVLFAATTLLVAAAIEGGYRIGSAAHLRSRHEKESPVSAIAGSVLALLAFILAFTFGIASTRYDQRKDLVRQQAVAIRTAHARVDFLPEQYQPETRALFDEYVGLLISAGEVVSIEDVPPMISRALEIERRLWAIGTASANEGMSADYSVLYLQALNDMNGIQATRVEISFHNRMQSGFWMVLAVLVVLGMLAVGYQTAIAASRRSWVMLMLAVSFAIVITLIAGLDNPKAGLFDVSHQPLVDLRDWMRGTAVTP